MSQIQKVVSVRRPKVIVFDILGTASKSGFLERILFPFLKTNLDGYIQTHWLKKDFIKVYKKIVEESVEFNKQDNAVPIVAAHGSAQAKATLLNFINYCTDNAINSTFVIQLRFRVWFEGYQQSKLRTPIYKDVPDQMRKWFAEGIKFHVFSNTWVEAQKALLRNTNHGDLTNLISGHYDNEFGALLDMESWRRLSATIRENPNDMLFLTKNPMEARAASDAGIAVVLVLTHRHNVKAVSKEDRTRFPYVRTLNELVWLDGAQPGGEVAGSASQQVSERSGASATHGMIPTAMSAPGTAVSQPPIASASNATVATGAGGSSAAAMTRSTGHSSSKAGSSSKAQHTSSTNTIKPSSTSGAAQSS